MLNRESPKVPPQLVTWFERGVNLDLKPVNKAFVIGWPNRFGQTVPLKGQSAIGRNIGLAILVWSMTNLGSNQRPASTSKEIVAFQEKELE